jgi:hypothetical protein
MAKPVLLTGAGCSRLLSRTSGAPSNYVSGYRFGSRMKWGFPGTSSRAPLRINEPNKVTIPSDLCLILKPSAPMSGTLANPRRQSPKASTCETLSDLCHHTEVLLSISTPCGVSTKCKLENFNFNLSGSDPIVANRAG